MGTKDFKTLVELAEKNNLEAKDFKILLELAETTQNLKALRNKQNERF